MASGDQYFIKWDERGTSVTAIFAEAMGATDGPDIKLPDGDGINFPNTEGPQGGKALIVESGGKEEGFNIEMSGPYHTGDYTIEICFWTSTDNLAGTTVGLQDMWSSDWPTGNVLTNTLRILGDGNAVSRPADDKTLEMACWEADGNELRVNSTSPITAQTWHTAQFVFEYNESDPANCSFAMYLDGTPQGSQTYNATITGGGGESFERFWPIYGTPATGGARDAIGGWRFGLGISMNRQISSTDNRGLQGAIDAFCISEGALSPGAFVLPAGFSPPPPTSSDTIWTVYE